MLVSPDCTNEDLYVAQKFTREAIHSRNVATRAPEFYGPGFGPFAALMQNAGQLAGLKKAAAILSIGLDGRYGWSVVAVELRKAVRRGARLVTIFPREHSLSSFSERWLPLDGPALAEALQALVRLTAGRDSGEALADLSLMNPDQASIARALVEAETPVIIVGPEYLADPSSSQVLEAVARLARQVGAAVLPLAPQSNLVGALRLGISSDWPLPNPPPLPLSPFGWPKRREGEQTSPSLPYWGEKEPEDERGKAAQPDLHVLYLVGETPSPADPAADFLVYQNFASYEGPRQPDLALPSAAFAEVDGTTINLEGRTRQVRKAVDPPGEALPDWLILSRIAQKMGVTGFDYPDAAAIQREMAQTQELHHRVTEITEEDWDKETSVPVRRPMPADTYRGFPLTTWVEGLRSLIPES
jgi:NADH dehydrogenase/NADH:ubiquinone oxidoreductase subunit G